MKVQLFTAASIALLQAYSAESRQVALESDAAGGGPLRASGVVSFLDSENKARCRQKCEKKDADPLFRCQSYCDDICMSDVKDAGDKCQKPCDYIDCTDDKDNNRSDSCSKNDQCPWDQYCKFDREDCKGKNKGECTDGGDDDQSCSKEKKDVCGCDMRTYSNECTAENFGVTIDYKGKCDDGSRSEADFGKTCRYDDMCNDGEYCKALHGECSVDRDRKGFCTKIPNKDDCKKLSKKKVCTCNGKTRDNECFAEYEEEDVKYGGSCN